MADFPYTTIPASLDRLFAEIQKVGRPSKVTFKWLSSIGFKSSNDRYIVGILKALGFVDSSGVPTNRWQAYRNKAQGRAVMAQGLRQAYPALFETYPDAYTKDDDTLKNFFGTQTNVGAQAISYMVRTFKALGELADFGTDAVIAPDVGVETESQSTIVTKSTKAATVKASPPTTPLLPITMNIQIVIPSDATAEQYDKIFSSIKKFLTKQE